MLCIRDYWLTLFVLRATDQFRIFGSGLMQSRLFHFFQRLQLNQIMRLQALHSDSQAATKALEDLSYLLDIRKELCETDNRKSVSHSRPVARLHCIDDLKLRVFAGIEHNNGEKSGIVCHVLLTMLIERLRISDSITVSEIARELNIWEIIDSVEESETTELNYPVEVLCEILETALLLAHRHSLKKFRIDMKQRHLQPNTSISTIHAIYWNNHKQSFSLSCEKVSQIQTPPTSTNSMHVRSGWLPDTVISANSVSCFCFPRNRNK